MLTREEIDLMQRRDALTEDEKALIQDTFSDLETFLRQWEYRPPQDDRAARLEAALVRYMLDSRP